MSVGSHDDAHTGEIGDGEFYALWLSPDAFKPDGFPVPGIVSKDPVRLRNGAPAFQISLTNIAALIAMSDATCLAEKRFCADWPELALLG